MRARYTAGWGCLESLVIVVAMVLLVLIALWAHLMPWQ